MGTLLSKRWLINSKVYQVLLLNFYPTKMRHRQNNMLRGRHRQNDMSRRHNIRTTKWAIRVGVQPHVNTTRMKQVHAFRQHTNCLTISELTQAHSTNSLLAFFGVFENWDQMGRWRIIVCRRPMNILVDLNPLPLLFILLLLLLCVCILYAPLAATTVVDKALVCGNNYDSSENTQ